MGSCTPRAARSTAFGGGKYRTPQAAGMTGKQQVQQHEAFSEVREAFRRVREVTSSASKCEVKNRMPAWQQKLADNLSRNRKLGSRQYHTENAHAAELYHRAPAHRARPRTAPRPPSG